MRAARILLPVALALVLGACAWLPGGQERVPPPRLYVLDPELPAVNGPSGSHSLNCGNLLVARPVAAPGYATSQMLYRNKPYELEAFAYNQWVAPPSQMLEPLIRRAAQSTGMFSAVLSPGSRADGQLYLESVSVRLLQVFTEGEEPYARLSLQARLYAGNRLLGERAFEATEPASAATPAAGVDAANRAAAELLSELGRWLTERLSAGENCGRAG